MSLLESLRQAANAATWIRLRAEESGAPLSDVEGLKLSEECAWFEYMREAGK